MLRPWHYMLATLCTLPLTACPGDDGPPPPIITQNGGNARDMGGAQDMGASDMSASDMGVSDMSASDMSASDMSGADIGGSDMASADMGGADMGGSEDRCLATLGATCAQVYGDAIALTPVQQLQGLAATDDTLAIGMNRRSFENLPWRIKIMTRQGAQWVEQAELSIPEDEPGDHLGFFVKLQGDTLLSHVDNLTLPGVWANALVVSERQGGQWSAPQLLTIPEDAVRPGGGFVPLPSIALDGQRAALGAPEEAAVLLFERGANGWAYTQAVRAPEGDEVGDGFGERVAISGDTLAANDYDGRVHLFTRASAQWTHTITVDSPTDTENSFGGIFALSGDTLVTTRQVFTQDGHVERAARVYTRTGGQWALTQTLKPDYPALGRRDLFAIQVELNGDHLAISSLYPPMSTAQSAGLDNPGHVYLYTRGAGSWTPNAYLSILEMYNDSPVYHIDFALAPSLILSVDHSGGLDADGKPNQRALMTTEL